MKSLCRELLHCCQFAVIRYENYSNQSLEVKSAGFVLGLFPAFSNYFIGYLELSNVPHSIFRYTKVCQAFVKFKMAVLCISSQLVSVIDEYSIINLYKGFPQ